MSNCDSGSEVDVCDQNDRVSSVINPDNEETEVETLSDE